MGSVPTPPRTDQDATAAIVLIKKEDRGKLSTSEKFKLLKRQGKRVMIHLRSSKKMETGQWIPDRLRLAHGY